MTIKEFADGWKHFCGCVDFAQCTLDAEAVRFMNEMPAAVAKGLTPDAEVIPCESSESSPG